MTQQTLELLQKALSLSEEERTALADSLFASLDGIVDEGAEKAWEQDLSPYCGDRLGKSEDDPVGRGSGKAFVQTHA
jgi:hypothetical protein